MTSRKEGKTQKVATAQTGFSERSSYNIEKQQLEEAMPRNWRTRKDPFASIH